MKATTSMQAKLSLLRGNATPGELILHAEQTYTFGRSRQNSLVLQDEHASRMHAKLYWHQGAWYIEDVSLNGTRLDGERIAHQKPTRIHNGQSLGIGDCLFRFELERVESGTPFDAEFSSGSLFGSPVPSSEPAPPPTAKPTPAQPHALSNNPPSKRPPSTANFLLPATNSPLEGAASPPRPGSLTQTQPPGSQQPPSSSAPSIRLDEMAVLCQFIQTVSQESNLVELVRQALQLLLFHTQSNVAGYLSVDPGEPLPKIVLPEKVQVSVPLSRQLTRRVQETGKLVWLGPDLQDTTATDSLNNVQDAVCVPLRGGGQTFAALHLYRIGSYFSDREVRFIEALSGYLSSHLHLLRQQQNLVAENQRLRNQSPPTDDLVGDSPSMQRLRHRLARAAAQPFNVLITGESGVGKEVVAYALHQQSPRRDRPFCVVNCATISPAMLEPELFGYVKNAFSGADHDHAGLIQSADEGTLFFDEISELSLDGQAKLERFIETKTFRPVGMTSETKVDVRIIAATNRDLDAQVQAGRFRPELLHRLRVLHLHVPPLREHPEDIPYLVQYFLDKLTMTTRREIKLTEQAIHKLTQYNWPGNVRQLRSVLEGSVALCETDTLDADAIQLPSPPPSKPAGQDQRIPPSLNLKQLRDWAIDRALEQSQNQYAQAASLLGVSVAELQQLIDEQNVSPEI
jgi:DNA-binding NtrC family response regulator